MNKKNKATLAYMKWQLTTEKHKYALETKDHTRISLLTHKRYLERKRKELESLAIINTNIKIEEENSKNL